MDGRGTLSREALKGPAAPSVSEDLVRETEKLLTVSYLLGRDHVGSHLDLADPDSEVPAISFDEAVKFAKARVPFTRAEWATLEPELRFRAFTVAALSTHDNVEKVRQMSIDAVEKGTSLSKFWTEANALDAAGLGSSPWYWETVYRTNTQTCYNAGRAAEFTRAQPEYLEFVGIEDGRQTEICAARSGVIRPASDPWWRSNWPPLHFNCRSTVRSVYQEEVDLLREADPAWNPTADSELTGEAPAKGFGGNPVSSGSFYKLTPAMVDRAKQYGILDDIKAFSRQLGLTEPATLTETAPATVEVKPVPLQPKEKGVAPSGLPESVPTFKSAKEAGEWIVNNNLADAASFKGCDVKVAQEFTEELRRSLAECPAARAKMQFFGTCQERNKLLMSIFEDKAYERYAQAGFDEATARAYAQDWAKTAIRKWRPSANTIAEYCRFDGVTGISLNTKYGKEYEAFLRVRQNDVLHGWKPVGTEKIAATIDHEFGHLLDDLSGLSKSSDLQLYYRSLSSEEIKAGLSGYAATSINEFVAEAWSEYRVAPQPRAIARHVAELLLQCLGKEGR